jgi:hypothetical protein
MPGTISIHNLPEWPEVTLEPSSSPLASSCSSVDGAEDAIFTINDLLQQKARNIPDQPLVGYPDAVRGASHYAYYTATDLTRFAKGAAQNLISQGLSQHVCVHLDHITLLTTG